MVECYWPGVTEDQAKDALVRVECARGEAGGPNPVRPLGCILVPADGMAFFLFAGSSTSSVQELSALIQLPFDRIVESIPVALRIA